MAPQSRALREGKGVRRPQAGSLRTTDSGGRESPGACGSLAELPTRESEAPAARRHHLRCKPAAPRLRGLGEAAACAGPAPGAVSTCVLPLGITLLDGAGSPGQTPSSSHRGQTKGGTPPVSPSRIDVCASQPRRVSDPVGHPDGLPGCLSWSLCTGFPSEMDLPLL